jgi:hypothetical protein
MTKKEKEAQSLIEGYFDYFLSDGVETLSSEDCLEYLIEKVSEGYTEEELEDNYAGEFIVFLKENTDFIECVLTDLICGYEE